VTELDLLDLTEELCAIPSVSHDETQIADLVESRLRKRAPKLSIERFGDNVVAQTQLGHERRIVLAGHLDTVPANGNDTPRREADTLHGLGAADMKGGLAVLLALAEALSENGDAARFHPARVLRPRGRGGVQRAPHPVAGDPNSGAIGGAARSPAAVEAGAGTLHRAGFRGTRAHSGDRGWGERFTGPPVRGCATADTVEVDGLPYRESLQVVRIEGGIANNVVPDHCTLVVNRRFAPAYSIEEARAQVEALLDGADEIDLVNASAAAPPNLWDPLVAELIGTFDLGVRPKLGWTDVARFAAHGVPALNFGPGDPELAHTKDELVTRESLDGCYAVLGRFLGVA
jgi:succinyl-diaminopimelate desuccinylase